MRRFFKLLTILILVCLPVIFICNHIIVDNAKSRLYSNVQTIPYNRIGILLGTSKYMKKKLINPYYTYRVNAAAELIRAKKIKYLVISGDNSQKHYNEPESMRRDLISAGIDSTILFMDFAGLRTFDSIKRLREVFGQDSATIISQKFHNERAIYLADQEGITAIGFNARDIGGWHGMQTQIREKLARVKVFIDKWLGTSPKYLGNKVMIPA